MTSHLLILILSLLIHSIDQSIIAFPPELEDSSESFRSATPGIPLQFDPQRVSEALEYGIQEATKLFETIEPSLYSQSIVIPEDQEHPALFLSAINHQTERVKNLSRIAHASLQATQALKEKFGVSQFRNENENGTEACHSNEIALEDIPLQKSNCLDNVHTEQCTVNSRIYRTATGTCNNLKHPNWGSSFKPFARYLPPEYYDDVSAVRKSVTGNPLPSARRISTRIHTENDTPKASAVHSLMMMQWGQFLDHDLTMAAQTRSFNNSIPKCCGVTQIHPECLPILVDRDDSHYKGTTTCLEFVRSAPSPRPDCGLGPREQLNQITSWLDGSVIYGSTDDEQQSLRLYHGGKLKYHMVTNGKPLLPRLQRHRRGQCRVTSPRLFCFRAGDMRVNQHPGLAAMHTVWLRQHNTIAETLSLMNPHWTEETAFQETRKIVIAQLQHITLGEFLPLLLGPNAVRTFGLRALRMGFYNGYNDTVEATVPTVFGTAAFRFGHSLVTTRLPRWDVTNKELKSRVNLSMELMAPTKLHVDGEVDRITQGLASQHSPERNEFITTELTNHLFKIPGHNGLDLAAINIQRDHGLPPYLRWREACGLLKPLKRNGPVVTWDDFAEATSLDRAKVEALAELYENPWDVDLFPGGMLEASVRGGLVGKTFACIIGQTFRNLRRGDRFWYENPSHFTVSQLQAIRRISLARVLCDTSDSITSIQPVVFLAPELQRNPLALCSNSDAIPVMDFVPWNLQSSSETIFHHKISNKKSSIPPVNQNMKPHFYSMTNVLLDAAPSNEDISFENASYKVNFTRRSS